MSTLTEKTDILHEPSAPSEAPNTDPPLSDGGIVDTNPNDTLINSTVDNYVKYLSEPFFYKKISLSVKDTVGHISYFYRVTIQDIFRNFTLKDMHWSMVPLLYSSFLTMVKLKLYFVPVKIGEAPIKLCASFSYDGRTIIPLPTSKSYWQQDMTEFVFSGPTNVTDVDIPLHSMTNKIPSQFWGPDPTNPTTIPLTAPTCQTTLSIINPYVTNSLVPISFDVLVFARFEYEIHNKTVYSPDGEFWLLPNVKFN